MPTRTLQRVIAAIPASDGAGVKLQRSLGQSNWARLDPFLMLDHFSSDDPNDYIAGFPAHPHRGFETVTYMLDGHMRHQDHLGNTGDRLERAPLGGRVRHGPTATEPSGPATTATATRRPAPRHPAAVRRVPGRAV